MIPQVDMTSESWNTSKIRNDSSLVPPHSKSFSFRQENNSFLVPPLSKSFSFQYQNKVHPIAKDIIQCRGPEVYQKKIILKKSVSKIEEKKLKDPSANAS